MSGGSLLASAAFAALVMNGLFGSPHWRGRQLAPPRLGRWLLGSDTGWEESTE